MNKALLLIFTRNPEKGKVKTRLASTVGDTVALDIYNFLLERTVQVTENLSCPKRVYYSEEINTSDIWDPEIYQKATQHGNDLGDRMRNAFQKGFDDGFEKVIIIGSDMFDLSKADVIEAFNALDDNEVAIGPATDGGYYLLGLTQLIPELFKNKAWGSSSVFINTINDLKHRSVLLLEEKNDVDYFEDIEHHPAFQHFIQHLKTS